jgi:hypothetical protein
MSYLVVGESLAGVAAALELASLGLPAHIILHRGDSSVLEDTFLIGPTPLNPEPMRGAAFSDLAFRASLPASLMPTTRASTRAVSAPPGSARRSVVDGDRAERVGGSNAAPAVLMLARPSWRTPEQPNNRTTGHPTL